MRKKFDFLERRWSVFVCREFYRGHGDCRSEKQLNIQILIWNKMTQRVWPSARQRTTNWTRKEEVEELDKLVRAQSEFLFRFVFRSSINLPSCATWDKFGWNTKKRQKSIFSMFYMSEIELEVNLKPLQCRQLWGRLKVDVFISRNTCWHRHDS